MLLPPFVAILAVGSAPVFLRGAGRRRPRGHGRELEHYREQVGAATRRIDGLLAAAAETVESLRHRTIDTDEAVGLLQAQEDELDGAATQLEEFLAPEELHGLHMEYEANLERALRGIVTAQRGISVTRLPHRPPDDEEPFNYWKRASQNIVHAQLRMREVVEVLLSWEPGKPAEVSVSTRLHRA